METGKTQEVIYPLRVDLNQPIHYLIAATANGKGEIIYYIKPGLFDNEFLVYKLIVNFTETKKKLSIDEIPRKDFDCIRSFILNEIKEEVEENFASDYILTEKDLSRNEKDKIDEWLILNGYYYPELCS